MPLYKSDVAEKGGIWYFDINDSEPNKHLKKSYHARLIPIHKQLIKLGFLDYVKGVKTKRIFPELKYDDKRYYQKANSAWFRVTYKKIVRLDRRQVKRKSFTLSVIPLLPI